MKRRAVFAVGCIALAVALGGTAGPHATAATPPILSAIDLQQFDIVPLDSANAVIDQGVAASIAQSQLDAHRDPDRLFVATVVVQPGSMERTAWVAVYAGGDPSQVSWGPAPGVVPTVDYTGIVIDATTAEVLFSFRGGRQ